LTPSTILIGVDTNEASIIVIINKGIAIKYHGIDLIGSISKFEIHA
jgi:hypothetical protein